jgi:two-component system cell cycle response regulator
MCSNVVKVTRPGADREKKQVLDKLNECLSGHAHDKNLNIDRLAKLMYMSRPTLYRKMKVLTGQTPNVLIQEARLKKAAELLATGEYRVFEVARMVGFTSQSSFGKSFLKVFKVTPTTYQRCR